MTTWHQFRDTAEGDDKCDRCAVVIAPEAHLTFTLTCPIGDCPAPANPDRGCVFVPGGSACCCIYCGRPGSREGDDPPIPDWLAALDLE